MLRQAMGSFSYKKDANFWDFKIMCLIIDVNFLSAADEADKKPVMDWLFSDKIIGKMAIGGKLTEELELFEKGFGLMRQLERRGRLNKPDKQMVYKKTQDLIEKKCCKSNDQHIIALAILSGARLLCLKQDDDLEDDFTNIKLIRFPKGKVYKRQEHKDLLSRYGHTKACGVKK
jgi:hypothetical protein